MYRFECKDPSRNIIDANIFFVFKKILVVMLIFPIILLTLGTMFLFSEGEGYMLAGILFVAFGLLFLPFVALMQRTGVKRSFRRLGVNPEDVSVKLTIDNGRIKFMEKGIGSSNAFTARFSDLHRAYYWAKKDALILYFTRTESCLVKATDMVEGDMSSLVDYMSGIMKKDFRSC